MTAEMTRAGMEAEARRRYMEAAARGERKRESLGILAFTVAVIVGFTLLLMVFAAAKRAERDATAAMEYAHYETVAMTGGVK